MDDLDRAKDLEMADRERALADQQARAAEADAEQPREVNGKRLCLDCGEPIPKKRLTARPNAVRCIDCKTRRERANA